MAAAQPLAGPLALVPQKAGDGVRTAAEAHAGLRCRRWPVFISLAHSGPKTLAGDVAYIDRCHPPCAARKCFHEHDLGGARQDDNDQEPTRTACIFLSPKQ